MYIIMINNQLKIINNSLMIRCYCSSSKSDQIKRLNYTSKALFGAVIKSKKNEEKIDPIIQINDHDNDKNQLNGEIYWLMKDRVQGGTKIENTVIQKDNVSANNSKISVDPPPPTETKTLKSKSTPIRLPSKSDTKSSSKTSISSTLRKFTKSLLPTPVNFKASQPATVLKPTDNVEIPFSSNDLQNMLKCPMIFNGTNSNSSATDISKMPSVSKILQATMPEASRKALMKWKLLKIAELGEDGFMELQKMHLTTGSNFHSSLQKYFETGEKIQYTTSPLKELWCSVGNTLNTIDSHPLLVEKSLYHPQLMYKGIVDCVSAIENDLTLIEWKKSDRSKPTIASTYDAPLQMCAYLGALSADNRYLLKIRKGLIVVAYTNGKPANNFELDENALKKYWRMWLNRVQEYWIRYRDGTLPEPI